MPDTDSREFFKCRAQKEAQRRICLYTYWLLMAVSPLETWRELFQDPWKGRGRPWQALWLQLSLILCMFQHLPLESAFTFGSLYKSEALTLSTCSAVQPWHLQSSSVATCFLLSLFFFFFFNIPYFLTSLLEYNCFTMLC